MNAILGALFFGGIVFLAIGFGERASGVARSTGSGRSDGIRIALCAAAAIVGGILVAHGAPLATVLTMAILCAALATTCLVAAVGGKLSPGVPGAALAVLIATALLGGDVGPSVSAFALAIPFVATALIVRDVRGDWQDPVVAALGGGLFGLQLGLVLVGFACLATILSRGVLRGKGASSAPVRFSLALAATFMVVLVGKLAIS